LAPYFFLALGLRFPKRYVTPLKEEIDFLEKGYFQPITIPLRRADLSSPPKNYSYRVILVLKISSRSFNSIKSYSTFFKDRRTDRQTDRQTHTQTMDKFQLTGRNLG
jgi:hypothetical protein